MRMTRLIGIIVLLLVAGEAAAQSLSTQDYIEIEQLYARYNNAIDSGNSEAWVATFTDDGVFNGSGGREALMKVATNWITTRNNLRHWNTNLLITPTAEGASATVYLFLMDITTKPPSITGGGGYEDLLVKTPQGWRFKRRTSKNVPVAKQ
jgi:hypothetical protein